MTFLVGTSDNEAVKLWANKLHIDTTLGNGLIADMLSDGILVEEKALSKGAGDRVRKHWSKRLTGKGIIGDNPVRPNAKEITYVTDDITVDKLTNAVRAKTKGSISQQRTAFDLEASTYPVAMNWFKDRMHAGAFNQLGGNTATSITFDGETYTGDERQAIWGLNSTTAPTTNRVIYADPSNNSSDDDVNTGTDAMTLSLIDDAVDLALTQVSGVNNFKPILGKPYQFKLYIGSKGYKSLIQEAQSNGSITLSQMELQRISSGVDNPYVGQSFIYNRTKVVEVPDHLMPIGNNAGTALTNVQRALFCGAEAGCLAFGQGYTSGGDSIPGFNIVQDDDPIEHEIITSVEGIFGIKKAVVDSEDQSVITISHYVS